MPSDPAQTSSTAVGRIVGTLVLLHIGGALMLPYILLNQVVMSPDFLESAARNPTYLRAPALLFLFGAAVTLGISIAAYPVLRQSSHRLALRSLALGVANFPLQVVESVPLRALLGYPVVMEMAMPLGPAYAGLGLWLIVKGFGERRGALDRTKLTFDRHPCR